MFPTDLLLAQTQYYSACHLELNDFQPNAEKNDYHACSFRLNKMKVEYREAKITPNKIGQFVAIWKRAPDGSTNPYHLNDDLDFIIISTRAKKLMGQFIFPKSVLIEKGIISITTREGKRGIRIYPPWDKAANSQAQKSQQWQLAYFMEMHPDEIVSPQSLTGAKLRSFFGV